MPYVNHYAASNFYAQEKGSEEKSAFFHYLISYMLNPSDRCELETPSGQSLGKFPIHHYPESFLSFLCLSPSSFIENLHYI